MVQLLYPCRTHLAPQPPFCWQSPARPLARPNRHFSGGTLSVGLHTDSLPILHADVGDYRLYGRSTQNAPVVHKG